MSFESRLVLLCNTIYFKQISLQISPGSIGERAGLQLDDMIIKINGEDVSKVGMNRERNLDVALEKEGNIA